MPKRAVAFKGFGVQLEVPDRVGQALRRVVPKAAPAPPAEKLAFAPPPALELDDRATERALMSDYWAQATATNGSRETAIGVDEHPWYHTIEFPDGRVTNGRFDHRELLPHYGFPDDLHGKRALDVGSGDGFWAFELERRGAEVTSLDIETFADVDLPRELHELFLDRPLDLSFRRGMELAARELNSTVKMVNLPVYDLSPETVGTFDFVHAGDILLHLRDPALALQRLRSVTDGQVLLADSYDPSLDALGAGPGLTRYKGGWYDATWWGPALSTLAQMVADAGFRDVEIVTTYNLSDIDSVVGPWRAVLRAHT